MADSTHWVKHIESYVSSSSSPTQQAADIGAIATLLKNDLLTLDALVKEMEMYLTTTDNIIRARGILLIAELLQHLTSMPLHDASMHSLIGFFTERLADWKALRGALVGCLSLLKRKGSIGTVSENEARAIVQSYLRNIQVQSLGQYDRKLCFELLDCLLDHYPDALVELDEDLIYGICEAIDEEKDPECLMLVFQIVEFLARLFPNPSGPLASFARDLFGILGCYFPIHFTHGKGEDINVKREELSRALMLAFASTPLFEPFAIPLLLEKFSSSLPSAKLESLKYLSYCTVNYGADRMVKHAESLWSSLKDLLWATPPSLSLESESKDIMVFQLNEIMKEALILLQNVVQQNNEVFLSLILGDEDINKIINSITSFDVYDDIPMQSEQRLHAVGCVLSVSAKTSIASCNRVFEAFFPRFVGAMEPLVESSTSNCHPDENYDLSARINFRALYLSVDLLDACRHLVVGSDELNSITVSANETWCCILHRFCSSLTEALFSTLVTSMDGSSRNSYVHFGVKGLQILATFPGSFLPVSKSVFEHILMKLLSIITLNFDKALLWKLVLRALVEIGSFIEKYHDSEKAASFDIIVVQKIAAWDDFTMPLSLKVEAISEIGMTGLNFMLRIVQGLDKAIFSNLAEVYAHGNLKPAEFTAQLLKCYSTKVFPWLQDGGGSQDVPLRFAFNMWDQIEKGVSFVTGFQEKKLLDAAMMAMKYAVASCSEESQSLIVHRAITILSSSISFPLKESMFSSTPVKLEGLQVSSDLDGFPSRDEWIISLFASVIIGLRPQTCLPDVKFLLQLFITTLCYGHIPSAQALGSLVNKMPLRVNGTDISNNCSLEEAVNMIVTIWSAGSNGSPNGLSAEVDGNDMGLRCSRLSTVNSRLLQRNAIAGLAWTGKGLLMRGHEKVKDITMTFLCCLLSTGSSRASLWQQDLLKVGEEQEVFSVMTSAADAFQILMCDSEACLNRRFYAIIRPLYKQRFFSTVMPILLSSVVISDSSITRSVLYRAIAHVISDAPLSVVLSEAKKLIPVLLDGLSTMSDDIQNRDIIYNVLLVLSVMLMDMNGQEAAVENAHTIISGLIGLISYPNMMLIRETAIQCLVSMSQLPHTRIYPLSAQVLRAMPKALDDPKRVVRQEAVRCRQAWASIASRSLQF